jgi:methyl-accepting chemotaxis protein
MDSTDASLERAKQKNSSKNLAENHNSEAEEMNWITDDIPVTIFRASSGPSETIHYLSNGIDELTGYSKADFLDNKLSFEDIIFREDIQDYQRVKQKAIKSKTPYKVEYRIRKADGSPVFVQEQATFVCDNKGKVVYIDGVFIDVTQEEKKYEEYQRVIINRTGKPLLVYLLDNSKKIKYINNYFVEICNVKSPDDLIGLAPSDIIETSTLVRDASKYKSVAEEVLDTGKAILNLDGFIKFKGADRNLYVLVSGMPIKNEAGVITGSLMILTDLTKIKDKEKEIQELLNYTNTCLKELGTAIKKVGEGDLDVHLSKIKDDEFGKTFDQFNEFASNLKSIIQTTINDMALTLEEARQAEEAVNQMNVGMQQISTASEQISTGAENLSRYAGTASSDVKASEEIFNKLSQSSNKSSNYASKAGKNSEETQALGNLALQDVKQFVEEISKLGNIIQSLDSAVNNIGAVTGKIKSIADQTNLLALNAAIEAARAGEHGRGFAVVADEVRKLAADSRKSTDDINGIVTSVQKETVKVTVAIDKAQIGAGTVNKNIAQSLNKINEVASAINTINSMLTELDKLAEEGLVKIESIDKSISEAASTAEENAASSEETSAAIQEQTAALQQVNTSAQNVSRLAQKTVDTLTEEFKTSAEEQITEHSSKKLQRSERKGSFKAY